MVTQMMLPENSITVIRGTSKTLLLTVTKPDGTAFDMTGGKLVFTVKEALYDDLPVLQKLTSNPTEGSITKPREGIAEFYLRPVDTNGMPPKNYVFDVWLITSGGDRFAVVPESTFVVSPGVTYLPT